MNRQRFSKNFDEIDRKSQVKMYKAGKNWVRKVISQISLLRVIRSRDDVTANISTVENRDCLDNRCHEYLKSILALGAAITGTSVSPTAFAEEYPLVVEQEVESSIDTLVDKDVVIVERVSSEIIDDSHLLISTDPSPSSNVNQSIDRMVSASGSESVSASSSASGSESVSASSSASGSESVSASSSVSGSESASVSSSVSSSESVSASSSVSSSESVSASSSVSGSESVSASELVSTSVRESLSTSESEPLNANGTVNKSETIRIAAELEYTTLDNAIRNLRHALSFPEIFEETGNEEKYGKYRQALSLARLALEQAIALREKDSVSQVELDAMALKAGQAAISLNGRIAQINPITAVVGTSTRATDTVRPEILSTNHIILFNGFKIEKPLVFAVVKETSHPDTWRLKGINYFGDQTSLEDLENGPNNILKTLPGIVVEVKRVFGTRDRNQYLISGTPVYNGDVGNRTFFTRSPFALDAAGNRMTNYVNGWKESRFVIVELKTANNFVNMSWDERTTADVIINKVRSQIKSGAPSDVQNLVNNILITPKDTLPAVNESKNINVKLTIQNQTNTADTTIFVNYPPSITNLASDIYVFHNEPTKVATKIADISDSSGQSITTVVENDGGLTPDVNGSISIGSRFTTGEGKYTRIVRATDNYNNSNSGSFVIRSYGVRGGNLIGEVGSKVTEDRIKNFVKSTVTGGDGLAGSGLDNLSSYQILSGDHEPTLGSKEVRVRASLSNGNYKDVVVTIDYRDTQMPTADLVMDTLYTFENQPLAQAIKLANLEDQGTGLVSAKIVAENSSLENGKGLTLDNNGRVTGSPIADSNGVFTNRIMVVDGANNTGYSSTFKQYVLRANSFVVEPREFTGNNKYSNEELVNLVKTKIARDSGITLDDLTPLAFDVSNHDYSLGEKVVPVTIRTPAGDTKLINVTVNYQDRQGPTITTKQDVAVFVNRDIELVAANTAAPVLAQDLSTPLTYSMPSASGITVHSSTGKVQGKLTAGGYYTRAVTVRDAANNSVTSENFWIRGLAIQDMDNSGRLSPLVNEHGIIPTVEDIKRKVVIVGIDDRDPIVTKELVGEIPITDGSVQVRLTTDQGVTTIVTVPINYTNQRPVINVPAGKEILRKPVGQATTIDLSEGVTVSDREDDRSPSDNLMTSVKYEIVDSTD
ncbi:TPA: KxYKxGKxW signal peptide domain-containing protein [Streptococcus suis]